MVVDERYPGFAAGASVRPGNQRIRHQANFDGVIDFDAVMQGPVNSSNSAVEIPAAWNCFDEYTRTRPGTP